MMEAATVVKVEVMSLQGAVEAKDWDFDIFPDSGTQKRVSRRTLE